MDSVLEDRLKKLLGAAAAPRTDRPHTQSCFAHTFLLQPHLVIFFLAALAVVFV